MKNTKNKTKVHTIWADIYVVRYEDTGEGYNTADEALKSSRKYLNEVIEKRATDELDGELQHSVASRAESISITLATCDDNGEESDGEDDGRWSICFCLRGKFLVEADDVVSARVKLLEEIEEIAGDPMDDSIEEYASDFSFDVV